MQFFQNQVIFLRFSPIDVIAPRHPRFTQYHWGVNARQLSGNVAYGWAWEIWELQGSDSDRCNPQLTIMITDKLLSQAVARILQ